MEFTRPIGKASTLIPGPGRGCGFCRCHGHMEEHSSASGKVIRAAKSDRTAESRKPSPRPSPVRRERGSGAAYVRGAGAWPIAN